jgi:hypothetical protein
MALPCPYQRICIIIKVKWYYVVRVGIGVGVRVSEREPSLQREASRREAQHKRDRQGVAGRE